MPHNITIRIFNPLFHLQQQIKRITYPNINNVWDSEIPHNEKTLETFSQDLEKNIIWDFICSFEDWKKR